MELLVFAHRGEAQTFLKEMPFKSHETFKDLYHHEDLLLLITKEGHQEVLTKLSYTLGLFPKVKLITNMGICGSFSTDLKISEIITPRTIYMEDEFKSYPCSSDSKVDLITTKKRVLSKENSKVLSSIATLVDREAYAVSMCAKTFQKDLKVFKMISDHIDEAEFCERIKENAEFYSDKLFSFYIDKRSKEQISTQELKIFSDQRFYFSVSQKRIYQGLMKALLEKYEKSEAQLLEELETEKLALSENKTPKEKSSKLIKRLQIKLYPFRTQVETALENLTGELRKYDSKFKFDKDLDKKSFKFEAFIDSEEKKKLVTRTLEKFDFKKFSDIMDGKLDV
ncbi:MAG: hypothetical protein VX341_05375 [Bdellovibrionota bacterium]|nr:hypothetical protein [Bdellovibrionota bacterium]